MKRDVLGPLRILELAGRVNVAERLVNCRRGRVGDVKPFHLHLTEQSVGEGVKVILPYQFSSF